MRFKISSPRSGSTSGSFCFFGAFAMADMFKAEFDLPAIMSRDIGKLIVTAMDRMLIAPPTRRRCY
jgi:hypothetical protein